MKNTPHFVLFSRTREQVLEHDMQGGSWYFRLESAHGAGTFEATDVEQDVSRERLELLAVVRGLEALEQPSSVTLITSSRQISRAVRQGLDYWRQRDWKWERFGEKVPMKNGDLWQRIDSALQIHSVQCRTYRIDQPHADRPRPPSRRGQRVKQSKHRAAAIPLRPIIAVTHWAARSMQSTADTLMKLVPEPAPNPHLTT